jgi:N-formylglutamate amidohydrolase
VIRLFIAVLVWNVAGISNAADADELIISRPGNLPIILTAPHGGQQSVPGAFVRTRGTMVTDTNTMELAEGLAKRLRTALGAEPYLVAARFSRKYIDANRAEAEAIESADLKPVYWAYHNRISAYIQEIRQKFPGGALLLDIHGQGEDRSTVHRGTRNGATVAKLLQKHSAAALVGPNSIFGFLQLKGFKVFPPNSPLNDPPEDRRFNGGHTVFTYGGKNPDSIDAIQLEVGTYLRTDSAFIDSLADGIVLFYRNYLGSAPQAGQAATLGQINPSSLNTSAPARTAPLAAGNPQ